MNYMCRLCLSDDGIMEPIFSEQNTNLLNKIVDLTSIKIKNVAGWPSGICEECKSKLVISVNFKKLCIDTQNTILEEIVVEEPNEENDSDAVILSNGKIDEEQVIEIMDSSDDDKSNSSTDASDDETYSFKRKSSRITKTSRKNYFEGDDSSEERPQKIRERRTSVKIVNYSEEADTTNNNNSISNLECETCHFTCKTKILLTEHRLLHANKKWERPFDCDVCNASFKNVNTLKQHQVCHTEKKHKCSHCQRKFRHQRNFNAHKSRGSCIYNGSSSTSVL